MASKKLTFIYYDTHGLKMKCPKCKKMLGYVRIETNEWVCRACGTISKIKNQKK